MHFRVRCYWKNDPESDTDVLIVAKDMPPDVGSWVKEARIREVLERTHAYRSLREKKRSTLISLDPVDEGIPP